MEGVCKNLVRWPSFNNLARIHYSDAVTDLSDDIDVMGNKHHREALLFTQVSKYSENLCLYGDIEGCSGFIGDD